MPAVFHTGAFETDHWKHAPEEQIHFFIVCQLVKDTGRNETIVCMVINHFSTKRIQDFVVSLCRRPFKECV